MKLSKETREISRKKDFKKIKPKIMSNYWFCGIRVIKYMVIFNEYTKKLKMLTEEKIWERYHTIIVWYFLPLTEIPKK